MVLLKTPYGVALDLENRRTAPTPPLFRVHLARVDLGKAILGHRRPTSSHIESEESRKPRLAEEEKARLKAEAGTTSKS
jgi:hypothetical protein